MTNNNNESLVDALLLGVVVAKAMEQPDVERIVVDSSMIDTVEYINSQERLRVEFRNGGVYEYLDVPRDQFDLMVTAESVGKYFSANIKNRFVTYRLDEV